MTIPNDPQKFSDEQVPGTFPTFTDEENRRATTYPVGSAPVETDTDPSATDKAKAKVQDTSAVARDEAQGVAESAKEGARHVAGEAKVQAGEVANEARRQVGDLVDQARAAASAQAGLQQNRAATNVRGLSDQFSSLLNGSPQDGVVTDLAHAASQRVTEVAGYLENRDPQDLLDDVTRFARRRPGAFLALAAGAGFLVGRLGRGVKDAGSDDSQRAFTVPVTETRVPVTTTTTDPLMTDPGRNWNEDVVDPAYGDVRTGRLDVDSGAVPREDYR